MSASQPGASHGGGVVRHLCCQLQQMNSQHINGGQEERARACYISKVLHQYAVEHLCNNSDIWLCHVMLQSVGEIKQVVCKHSLMVLI